MAKTNHSANINLMILVLQCSVSVPYDAFADGEVFHFKRTVNDLLQEDPEDATLSARRWPLVRPLLPDSKQLPPCPPASLRTSLTNTSGISLRRLVCATECATHACCFPQAAWVTRLQPLL